MVNMHKIKNTVILVTTKGSLPPWGDEWFLSFR